jgi:hypothetical protein
MIAYRSLALAVPALVASMALVACGDAGDATPKVASQQNALASSVCPDLSLRQEERGWYQMKASRAAAYLFGGIDPRKEDKLFNDGESDPMNPACGAMVTCLDHIRVALARGSASATPSTMGKACDLEAGVFQIKYAQRPEQSIATQIEDCAEQMDMCWGKGVSGFFYVVPSSGQDKERGSLIVEVDPQPAQATVELFGSNGATAAAVWLNTTDATTILKWPSVYSAGSSAAAGTPCSNFDMLSGETTAKFIQVLGSYRRCY